MNATYNGKISIISTYREAPSNMIMAKDFTIDPETLEGDINPDTWAIISDSFWQHNMNIKAITFEDTLSPKEDAAYTYDISANQDGSVMAYLVENGTLEDVEFGTIPAYDMYIKSNGKVYANYDCSWLFGMFANLTEINNLQNLDTSYVTNMSEMFAYMYSLTELDLSHFDTSNVTDMSYMFRNVESLTNLNLSSFDTSNVTNMSEMFSGMSSLTELDLSSFDTSNVTNMSWMFADMYDLTELGLSSFDTSNVTDMSYMFAYMSSLTQLDLSSFDTSNVTDMSDMFSYMEALIELDVSSFDTSNVTDMSWMFYDSSSLTNITYGSKFIYANTADVSDMFSSCPANRPTDSSWEGII